MSNHPELVEKLRSSSEEFLTAAEGIAEAQARAVPAAGGWSILECVEHIVVAETMLFERLSVGRTPLSAPLARNLEAAILGRGADRGRKFDAPDTARPTGRFATLEEALAAFRNVRAGCIAWVESSAEDLRGCSAAHPLFGPVTGYEMALMIAMHTRRHALQIRELRS